MTDLTVGVNPTVPMAYAAQRPKTLNTFSSESWTRQMKPSGIEKSPNCDKSNSRPTDRTNEAQVTIVNDEGHLDSLIQPRRWQENYFCVKV